MEPIATEGFNRLGLGSIPLILLHHLLFQLDPNTDRRFNNAKSHSSLQIRARTFLEETP
jgi:hypothetical protein